MTRTGVIALLVFVALLAVPYVARRAVRADDPPPDRGARRLVIITPHIEQIRTEFGEAFDDWHRRRFGEPVSVVWLWPGGTSEILRLLEAEYIAAAKAGRGDLAPPRELALPDRDQPGLPELRMPAGSMNYDLMMGGGSFEHARLKTGTIVNLPTGQPPGGSGAVRVRYSEALGFDPARLEGWFGPNQVGGERLYDPDQYWVGSALSGFGIVYNRLVLRDLGLPEPRSFADLTDPRYRGRLALTDPRLSGSVTTAYDSILNKEGWDEGWRILREMSANAMGFATTSTTAAIDVSQGQAAAGISIDFYGRGQAQAVLGPGEDPATGRVGYIDPPGATYIDSDPVSVLQGGPDPELARRFVQFCLSDEGQALWQFPARTGARGQANPAREDGTPMGPRRHDLRRMPSRRAVYDRYLDHFVDKVQPFEVAADVKLRGWRSAIGPLMASMAIDSADHLRAAWDALSIARADPAFPPETLAAMERAFAAMPPHTLKDGTSVTIGPDTVKAVSDETRRWTDPVRGPRALAAYTAFFRAQFAEVARLEREARRRVAHAPPGGAR